MLFRSSREPPTLGPCEVCPQHSLHFNVGAEAVHVDVPIQSQLLGELGGQQLLGVRGEVPKGIPQRQLVVGKGREVRTAGAFPVPLNCTLDSVCSG